MVTAFPSDRAAVALHMLTFARGQKVNSGVTPLLGVTIDPKAKREISA